jgi:hypothetical protein
MPVLAPRQLPEARPVSLDQGELLGSAPPLDLSLDGKGLVTRLEVLRPKQTDRTTLCGVACDAAA